jgi:hypothetical protein
MWVHVGASLNVGEKSNIFRSVAFQNVVQNSCNAGLEMHLQVDPPEILNQSGGLMPRIGG